MTTEAVKFDPSSIANALKDRIRSEMLNVIPDEVWKAMIEAECKAFMSDRSEPVSTGYGGGYDRRIVPAGIKLITRQLLEEEARARIKEMFQREEWRLWWKDNGEFQAGSAMRATIEEMAPALMKAYFQGAVVSVVQAMQNSLGR